MVRTIPAEVPNVVNTGTLIRAYYEKRTDLTLTINHYLTKADGSEPTLKESSTITELTFNDTINGADYKNTYAGYTYDSSNPETINVSENNNVLDLYYRANSDTQYTINYYLEDLNNNYILENTETLTGETNTQIRPTPIEYTGFKTPNTQTITIAGDGNNVVDYYYERNSYKVTILKGNGISNVYGSGTYKYEASVTILGFASTGYTWSGWSGDKESSDERFTFTMPANELSFTANAIANTYTVVYDGNGATAGSTETSTHTYNVAKNLTANGFERKYTITYDYNYDGKANTTKTVEYEFDGWKDRANGNEYSDEASVINLETTNNASRTLYAKWQQSSDINIPTRNGYKFTGWYTSEDTTGNRVDRNGKYTPTANITLYAGWVLDDGSTKTLSYTVEYYKDNIIVNSDTEVVSIEVDANAADTLEFDRTLIDNNKYNGYVFKNTDPNTIPNIVNTGSVIKVYYEKKTDYNLTINHYLTNSNGENPK